MAKQKQILAGILSVVLLAGCSSGTSTDPDTSEQDAAIKTVEDYFSQEFSGCTLTSLEVEDISSKEQEEYCREYDCDQVLVLTSSFDVDAFSNDASFNSGATYTGWQWILIRNEGQDWQIADYGY